jgi:hypothetical protein
MNVAEKLAREIRRVSTLRANTASLRSMPNVNVEPLLLMLDAALERACRAAGLDDAVAQIAAGQDLEAFTE